MTELLVYSGVIFILLGLSAHGLGLILPGKYLLKSSFLSRAFQVEYLPILYETEGWKKWVLPECEVLEIKNLTSQITIKTNSDSYEFSVEQFLVGKKIELRNAAFVTNKYGSILWSISFETKQTDKGTLILLKEEFTSGTSLQNILLKFQYQKQIDKLHGNRISRLKELLG